MRRFKKIVKRILSGLALTVLLLAVSAVIFARTDYARDRLREEVRSALAERFGLEATFEDAEVELIPPRGHVLGVEILGADGEPFVTVERLTVGFAPTALVAGKVEIDEISLEEPHVQLVVEGGEISNLPDIRQQQQEGSDDDDTGGSLADVGVLAGTVDLEVRDAPGGPLHVQLTETNIDVTSEGEDTDIRLLIAGGVVEQGEVTHPIDLIRGRVLLRREENLAIVRRTQIRVGPLRTVISRAEVGLDAPHDVEGSVELWVPLSLVGDLPLPAPPLNGDVHIAASVTRSDGRLAAEGNLEIAGLVIGPERFGDEPKTYGPHAVGDISASFQYLPDQVTVPEITIDRLAEGDGAIVARNLVINLADERIPIDAEVEFQGTELAHILIDAGLYASRVRAKIDGTATLHGYFAGGFRLRVRPVNLRVRDFAVLTASITKPDAEVVLALAQAAVRGKVVIDAERIRLRNMTVTFGRTALSVLADLSTSEEWFLRAESIDDRFYAEDIGTIAGLAMEGTGHIQAHIHGTYGDPTVDGNLDLQDFNFGGVDFGDARGSIRYHDLLITLPSVTGTRGTSTFTFEDGRVDFRRRRGITVDGVAHLDPVGVAEAREMFHLEMPSAEPLEADVRGVATIHYESVRDRWTVGLEGQVVDAVYQDESLGTGDIDLTYDGGDINIRSLLLRHEESLAMASGTVGKQGELDLLVTLRQRPFQSVTHLPEYLETLQGDVTARVQIGGTTAAPEASGEVEVSQIRFHGNLHGSSSLQLTLSENETRLWGRVAGGRLNIDELTLGMREPWPVRLRGQLHNVDLDRWLPQGQLPEGMRVRLSGVIDGGVDFPDDFALSGTASITALEVAHPAFNIRNTAPLPLRLRRRKVRLAQSEFALRGPDLPTTTTFSLGGWISPDELNMGLQGALNLGFVPSLVGFVTTMDGTLAVNCQVSGELAAPIILGQAETQISELGIDGLPEPVRNVQGRLQFSQNAVVVEGMTGRFLGGQAQASGLVALSGFDLQNYQLGITLRDSTLSLGPRSSVVANAALVLTNPQSADDLPLVGGRVEIVRLRYQEPIRVNADLGGLTRRRVTQVQTYDRARDQIRFDVHLVGSNNMRIDNNLAEASVFIDDAARPFRLVGTNQTYSALGTVVVEPRGTVNFRNTEYEIERGILSFDDAFDINPSLDFVATATRRDWVIALRVSGTRRDPVISLSSDPPLSDRDVAALLTFGMTLEELEQTTTIPTAVVLDVVLGGLDETINEMLPMVDEFRITSDYSSRTGQIEPRVQVSRRLSDRIRLGASAGLSEARDFETNLEVEITENLSAGASYENDTDFGFGNIGGDLRWRIEF